MKLRYITTRQLKEFGWTPTQIKLLKSDSSKFETVPFKLMYHGGGYKSQMYETRFDPTWVEQVKTTDRWQELEVKKNRRRK